MQISHLKALIFQLKICSVYDPSAEKNRLMRIFYYSYNFIVKLSIIITLVQCFIYIAQRPALMGDTNFLRDIMFYITGPIFVVYMNWAQRKLYGLIGKLQTVVEKTSNPIEELTIDNALGSSERYAKMWISYLTVFCLNYAISTFLAQDRTVLIPAWFPFDVLESPIYELTWLWQSYCFYIMTLAHCIGDTVMMSCITLIGYQFKILGSNLKYSFYQALKLSDISQEDIEKLYQEIHLADINGQIIDGIMRRASGKHFEKHLYDNLCQCVKHHQFLLECCADLIEILSPTLFPRVGVCTFFLLVSSLTVLTQTDSNELTKAIITCAASLTTTAILNFLGEQLTQNADIYDAITDTPWYLYDVKSKMLMISMMQKLKQLPFVKAGPFFILNYATFVSIMRASYSYIIYAYQFITEE